ncbi:hypothetical protein D3C81_1741510 [compost metagenome]
MFSHGYAGVIDCTDCNFLAGDQRRSGNGLPAHPLRGDGAGRFHNRVRACGVLRRKINMAGGEQLAPLNPISMDMKVSAGLDDAALGFDDIDSDIFLLH